MSQMQSNNFYDMGSGLYRENMSRKVAQFIRENLFIGIPARVTNVSDYETLQCLDVKPVIDDVYVKTNGIVNKANTLKKIFVRLPAGGGFALTFPVAKGDIVTLCYCHKDLGDWLDSEGTEQIEQSVFKTANIEDCWIELGGGTRKNHQNPSSTNLVLKGENVTITITPEGDIEEIFRNNTVSSESITTTASGSITTTTPTETLNGDKQINGNLTVSEQIQAAQSILGAAQFTSIESSGETGVSGTFTTSDSKTVTVTNGIITSIV